MKNNNSFSNFRLKNEIYKIDLYFHCKSTFFYIFTNHTINLFIIKEASNYIYCFSNKTFHKVLLQ